MQTHIDSFDPMNVLVVIRRAPKLVQPVMETPQTVLYVPAIRAYAGHGNILSSHTLFLDVHHHNRPGSHDLSAISHATVHAIERGLERVLVPYYPLAGRLRPPTSDVGEKQGKLELACNGLGAIFVEAKANLSLQELRELDKEYWSELQYKHVTDSSMEVCPLVVQVTMLACGGFVLSLQVLQSLCDTAGVVHFLHAWSEYTKAFSHDVPIVTPIWCGMIPSELPGWPQKFHFPNLEALQIPASHMHIAEHSRMLHYIGSSDYSHYENNNSAHHAYHSERRNHSLHDSIDLQDLYPHKPLHSDSRYQPFSGNFIGVSNMSISLENLSFLKDSIFGKCNKFEALTALFWRERTRLLDFPPSSEVVLFFPAPVAQDVHLAFYGKYGFNCMVTARASELVQSDLSKVVRLIQDAQVEFAGQFLECMRKFIQLHAYETQKHAPRHVLLFTVLSHVVEGFDFGTDVHPYLHGVAHVPCPVNVVAITGCSEDNIEVVITNAPLTLTDKISLHLHQHPMLGSDSKL